MFQIRLKELREQARISQYKLAKEIGVSQSTVGMWENGSNKPEHSKLIALSNFFNVSVDYLLDISDVKEKENDTLGSFSNIIPFSEVIKKRVPVLGDIACGKPIYAEEQYGDFIDCGVDADFALTCRGNSMIDARINDGDLVFIKKQDIVENGAIAAVIIDNEATLKRVFFYPETKKLILQAANPQYEPLVYIGAELENVRILGRAIAFQSML